MILLIFFLFICFQCCCLYTCDRYCTNERSKGIIARILEKGDTNAYTIEKKGIRKMIYQTAWRREDGTVGGIIELSMPIPAEMPHYVRG